MRKLVFALTRLTAVAYHLGLSQARARFGATVTVNEQLKDEDGAGETCKRATIATQEAVVPLWATLPSGFPQSVRRRPRNVVDTSQLAKFTSLNQTAAQSGCETDAPLLVQLPLAVQELKIQSYGFAQHPASPCWFQFTIECGDLPAYRAQPSISGYSDPPRKSNAASHSCHLPQRTRIVGLCCLS